MSATRRQPVQISYDRKADTLYLALRSASAIRGEDLGGIVRRFDEKDELFGLTILDIFDFWLPDHRDEVLKFFLQFHCRYVLL